MDGLSVMAINSVSLIHVIRRPVVMSAVKPPLLVLLHGVGSNEDDLMGLAPYLDGRFLIASLRAPLTLGPGAFGWFAIEWTAAGITYDESDAAKGQATAEQAIRELVSAYDVDPERVYLMGFSQGAIMSLGIATSRPEMIAGAVIMSGRLRPGVEAAAAESDRLAGLPIIVVHGTLDTVLPIESGRKIAAYLRRTPVDLTYREYPMAHTVSQESLSDIAEWLTKHMDSPTRS